MSSRQAPLPPPLTAATSSPPSSSSAAVLLDASSSHDHPSPFPHSQSTPSPPRLLYPYPLPFFGVLDVTYTVLHVISSSYATSTLLLLLALARGTVLICVLGMSRRWRHRGGWVGGVGGLTVGAAVWEGCAERLQRGVEAVPVHVAFLVTTAVIALVEYLMFLLLLRLSPPSRRSHPLSLRQPYSALQSPTSYRAAPPSPTDLFSPTTASRHRRVSRHSFRSHQLESPNPSLDDLLNHHSDTGEDEDDGEEDEDEDTASESSIIDLPPPLSPSRIVPPRSISARAGLDIAAAAIEDGPLVRRTRSARALARSWGSRRSAEVVGQGEEMEDGYGTFRA